jgi:hypothetical protein
MFLSRLLQTNGGYHKKGLHNHCSDNESSDEQAEWNWDYAEQQHEE